MNILFYLEPQIELGNPKFRLGALKNQIKNIAIQCANNLDARIDIIVSDALEYYEDEFESLASVSTIHYVNSVDFYNISPSSYELINDKFLGKLSLEKKHEIKKLLLDELGGKYEPDVVVTWESANGLLKTIYKDALFIDMMPGFISRAPYPDLISIDFSGFFKYSSLNTIESSSLPEPTLDDTKLLNKIRSEIVDGYFLNCQPFKREDVDPEGKFEYLILVPLQVSGYFSFNASSKYSNSLDFALDVLNNVPSNCGVVFTQYVTSHTKDIAITKEVECYLSNKFDNFIYLKAFDEIDSVSQYLLKLVDGVATVSSSIGFQSLLYKKPVFVFGDSHLTKISSGNTPEDILHALEKRVCDQDKLLSFLLSHVNVLSFSKVVGDDWYSNLIYEYHSKWKRGLRGIDLYTRFSDLYSDYVSKFEDSIRPDVAFRKLDLSLQDERKRKELSLRKELFSKISSKDVDIVSFDIFDTLLERPFSRPADVFKLMNQKVKKLTNGKVSNFDVIRVEAERSLRKLLIEENTIFSSEYPDANFQHFPLQEMTLDDIYNRISTLLQVDLSILEAVKNLEIDIETKILKPRKIGQELYKHALKSNKKVVITSDMYLSLEVITNILKLNDFDKHFKLYLSSDLGFRKHEGQLFEYVLNDLKLSDPSRLVHVGDNLHGDISSAKKYGIKTLYLERSFVRLSKNKKFKKIYWDTRGKSSYSEGTFAGLISNKLFSNTCSSYWGDTHFNGLSYNLGYSATGPMFFSFSKWLVEESIKNNVDRLYFLARDGYVLKRVYDQISKHYPNAPKSSYLYASRRNARVCSLENVSDIIELSRSSFFGGTLSSLLDNKFGVDVSSIDISYLESHGFASFDEVIDTQDKRERALQLILSISEVILESARVERENYISYLDNNGLNKHSKGVAIVDIGYAGSMQQAISKLSSNDNVAGYYFMTFDSAFELNKQGLDMYSFSGAFLNPSRNQHPLLKNGLAYEVLFSNTQGSFIKIDNGKVIKKDVEMEGKKKDFLLNMWAGVDAFVSDYLNVFSTFLSDINLSSDDSISVISDFFANPGGRDCEILEGVTFDDAFSGASIRYMIPPRKFSSLGNQKLVRMSVWNKGTEVFFRRPDIQKPIKKQIRVKAVEDEKSSFLTKNKLFDFFINRRIKSGRISKNISYSPLVFKILTIKSKKKGDTYKRDPYSYLVNTNNKWLKRTVLLCE